MPVHMTPGGYLEEGAPDDSPDEVLSSDPHAGMPVTPSVDHSNEGLGGFAGEAWKTTPFNPKNIWDFLMNTKPEDMGRMVETAYNHGKEALGHFAQAAGPGFGALGLKPDPEGQMAALKKGASESLGAVPMIGPALMNIKDQIGAGKYAQAAGGTTGLASNLLIPDALAAVKGADYAGMAGAAGRGAGMLGRGMEALGGELKGPALTTAPLTALMNHPGIAALELAAPPMLKYGGRGVQALGRSLEGLDSGVGRATVDQGASQYAPGYSARANQSAAGSVRPTAPRLSPVTAAEVLRDQSRLPDSLQALDNPVQTGAEMYAPEAGAGRTATGPGSVRQGFTNQDISPAGSVKQSMSDPSIPESPLDAAARQSVRDVNTANNPPPSIHALDASVGDATIEQVTDSPTVVNGSGESAASAESMSRNAGMASRGEQFVYYDRGGMEHPAHVDYTAQPGQTFGVKGPEGFRALDNRGGQVPTGPSTSPMSDSIPESTPTPQSDLPSSLKALEAVSAPVPESLMPNDSVIPESGAIHGPGEVPLDDMNGTGTSASRMIDPSMSNSALRDELFAEGTTPERVTQIQKALRQRTKIGNFYWDKSNPQPASVSGLTDTPLEPVPVKVRKSSRKAK